MITRKEFIDSVMEFANRMADTIYGAQKDLFSQASPVEDPEPEPFIGRFKPRCAFPRVGDIAKHYKQQAEIIHRIILSLGIEEIKPKGAHKIFCISREDCSLLVQVIEKKYNNFN